MAGQPTAVIYFGRGASDSAMAKDLAARVRNDGVKTLLIWGDRVRDESDIEETARAVIIQRSVGNAQRIASMYEAFAAGVEIHYVDDEGEFLGDEGGLQVESEADAEAPADQEEQAADAADAGEEPGGGPDAADQPDPPAAA